MIKRIGIMLLLTATFKSYAVNVGDYIQTAPGSLAGRVVITDTEDRGVLMIASLEGDQRASYKASVEPDTLILDFADMAIERDTKLLLKVVRGGEAIVREYPVLGLGGSLFPDPVPPTAMSNQGSSSIAPIETISHDSTSATKKAVVLDENKTTPPVIESPSNELAIIELPEPTPVMKAPDTEIAPMRVCPTSILLGKDRLMSHVLEEFTQRCGYVAAWEVQSGGDTIDYFIDETITVTLPQGIETLKELLVRWYSINTETYQNTIVFKKEG